jgi:hypothetical protein
MEPRAVTRFFMLKGMKARAIQAKLESVHGPEVLALPTPKKSRRDFHQERTDLFYAPKSGRPLTNDPAGVIGSMLEERLFSSCKVFRRHFRIGKMRCLRILHDELALKRSIFAGCRMPYRSATRAKDCDVRSSF